MRRDSRVSDNSDQLLEQRIADLEARVVRLRTCVWSLFGLIVGMVFFGDVVAGLLVMVLFPAAIVAAVAGLIYVISWAANGLTERNTAEPGDLRSGASSITE